MHFAQPYWLLLILLVPALVTLAVVIPRVRRKQWTAFVAPRLRSRLLLRGNPVPRWVSLAFAQLSLIGLAVTLARPQSDAGIQSEAVLGRNILIALDLSRSMKTPDLKPDRLTQAKALSYELLDALPDDRIGLVGFAGSPYLFAPLTVDHSAVREMISQVDIDWIPTGGSNLAGGLEMAIDTLKKTGTRQNALILLTDGEEHIGRIGDLAADAKAAGIQIITIGFGTAAGDYVPDDSHSDGLFRDRQGERVISHLEPGPLKRVASVTGGRFAVATSGSDIPSMVTQAVKDLDQVELKSRRTRLMIDYFQWALLPSILCLMVAVFSGTRWRGLGHATALLTLALVWTPHRVEAITPISYQQARSALQEGRLEEAKDAFGLLADENPDAHQSFSFRLAQGTAAYRSGDWSTARHAFSEALRSDDSQIRAAAHHGLGNTLFEIGWARLSGGLPYPELPQESDTEDPSGASNGFKKLSDAIIDPPKDDAKGDLIGFEKMAKERLSEWMSEETEPGETSAGSLLFHELLSDWIDSMKHHGASGLDDSEHNRDLTLTYLEKLEEILKQVEDNAQQIQALPMPGEGEPQEGQEGEGDGEPSEDGEGKGKAGDSEGHGDSQEAEGGDQPDGEEQEGPGGDQEDESDQGQDGKNQPKPGETDKQAAERILRENADLQKGALSPGRARFRPPEKDW
ncbi:tetratricopeptide (TPR) repeat protein [Haloferula luteola]|uniref:Tetratricopeptide (TPR) repeat protein n=1 Tax=Haloferula luteola TaxID=595692 RepID=A0A840UXW8_9BACT|nr:VWA domain-containing protein [Haloferula luteola]MBB5349793.1 tetratricopeptide (TPR) repeat protein [Haloferula luteola]